MKDVVSRQEVIEAIKKSAEKYTGFMEMEQYTEEDAIEAVNKVPSVVSKLPECEDAVSKIGVIQKIKSHYRAHDNDLLEVICREIEEMSSVRPKLPECDGIFLKGVKMPEEHRAKDLLVYASGRVEEYDAVGNLVETHKDSAAPSVAPKLPECEDVISRRAAIDAVMNVLKRIPTSAIRAKDVIENLPSVMPKPNEGKWILKKRWSFDSWNEKEGSFYRDEFFCSECGFRPEELSDFCFCPSCGAMMKEEAETSWV